MLCEQKSPPMTPFDEEVFKRFIPEDHILLRVAQAIDWGRFRPILAPCYSADQGRPSEEPIRLLKFEFLRYLYNLSDSGVMKQAKTDVAFRYFLQMDSRALPPNPSTLSIFRGRLGAERFREVFDELTKQARELGIVKERLRLKDATHIIASVAIPTIIRLVAQIRDKLLACSEPWARELVNGEQINAQWIREQTAGKPREQKLMARVAHLQDILAWADELSRPNDSEQEGLWQEFLATRKLAHQILSNQQNPKSGDHIRSIVDPDVRRSKHGDWFDGYTLDVLVDADSEFITSVNVLPANGNEAEDAVTLVNSEEAALDNKVQALSMDGAGYNGPLLNKLEDPEGLALETHVPPRKRYRSNPAKNVEPQHFVSADFRHDPETNQVICPAGKRSRYVQKDKKDNKVIGWIFRYYHGTCESCPLQSQCMVNPPKTFGKVVHKSKHHDVLQKVHDKAKTEKYAAVRSEHAKVERKLGDIVNNHGGRRARYCGLQKVLTQEVMACFATNVNRLVRLLYARKEAAHPT